MTTSSWALQAADFVANQCIQHRKYRRAVESAFNALGIAQPGEVVVVVGPSRVGKSRAVSEAINRLVRPRDGMRDKPYVVVQAENASTQGSFSTKAFMQALCRAIEHPMYGLAEPDDPWGIRISTRVNRTPEALLRDAVEHGLSFLNTRYLIVDEAHHVGYAGRNSSNALAVLDSWKCLAAKTNTVLCLVGSYQLLDILAHAPHLLGRQRLIEFPRYRASDPDDVAAFMQVLITWCDVIRFDRRRSSSAKWARFMFNHSFGCVGHLSRWLMSALGEAAARESEAISDELFRSTRHPRSQEAAIAAEIEAGERAIARTEEAFEPEPPTPGVPGLGRPFRRKTRRFPINGRTQ